MLGMFTSLTQDVPPFIILSGNPAAAHGVNVEGLRRRGFTREEWHQDSFEDLIAYAALMAEAKGSGR